MSIKELTKEDFKNLSHDDLIRLGATLAIKHLADSLEKRIQRKRKKNETLLNRLCFAYDLFAIHATETLASLSR